MDLFLDSYFFYVISDVMTALKHVFYHINGLRPYAQS